MGVKILVPEMGESVVEATVGEWLKKVGDSVLVGEILVELETDKVDVEVGAESAGVLTKILHHSGDDVAVGDVLAEIDASGIGAGAQPAPAQKTAVSPQSAQPQEETEPVITATPVAMRMAEVEGVNVAGIPGTGPKGRVTKQDVAGHLSQKTAVAPPTPTPSHTLPASLPDILFPTQPEQEERIKMSRRRRTIAKRLVEAQQTSAMLTTFNEIDMTNVMSLRERRQEEFVKQFGVKVGFTSFFVKAVVGALKAFPRLNAELNGNEMLLKHYYDIGIAVGAEEGLVVPVLRDADRMNFAEVEKGVKVFAQKSREGNLTIEDLRGGTFTITNGGVFGSMLSTPILNPPQVGILGLHNIVERPVAINREVHIRPIMYTALTYDHRIVDGREAVQFLVKIKQLIEDPEKLLLEG